MKLRALLSDKIKTYYNQYLHHTKYWLRLEGYFINKKTMDLMLVISLKNKRTVEIENIYNIYNNKNYILALHPVDCCFLGILMNNQKNHFVFHNAVGLANLVRFPRIQKISVEPYLKILPQKIEEKEEKSIVLYAKNIEQTLSIGILDLIDNYVLLSGLTQQDAMTVGTMTSNIFLKDVR